MKKILCSMLLALLMVFGAVGCFAAEAEAEDTYIYMNYDFDDHREGEFPKLFGYHHYDYGFYGERAQWKTALDSAAVATKIEKDGNSDNIAAKFNADTLDDGNDAIARAMLQYYPIKDEGVISFSFRVEDFKVDRIIKINGNVNQQRHVSYADNKNYWTFLSIKGDKVLYRGNKEIASGITANTWYRIDFVFDISSKKATLYFDGKATSVSLPETVQNISEVQFDIPELFDGATPPGTSTTC